MSMAHKCDHCNTEFELEELIHLEINDHQRAIFWVGGVQLDLCQECYEKIIPQEIRTKVDEYYRKEFEKTTKK